MLGPTRLTSGRRSASGEITWYLRPASAAKLTPEQQRTIERVSRRVYKTLELRGYARIDFRLSPEGELHFLEANPNPELAKGEEVATAAQAVGLDYPELLEKILRLGMRS